MTDPNPNPWPASMRQVSPDVAHREPTDQPGWPAAAESVLAVLSARFERIEPIRDGTRTAFRAYSRTRRLPVKLRVVSPSRSEVVRSLKEVRVPAVVAMRDSELLPDGNAVLVMEQIAGRTLQDILDRDGAVPEGLALSWMKQVCEAMTYVAARQIVHRNLKPANIVVDDRGNAHVIDFDWSAFAGSAEGLAGTPRYMSPEQWKAPAVPDVRDDLFSLGATFYHVMTGAHPVPDEDLRQGWETRRITPPQSIAPQLSTETARILERCLATRPGERFQSFVELLTQLEHPTRQVYLGGPPPALAGYHLLSCLGEGGMGIVFQAHALTSDRRVALKFIRGLGPNNLDLLARFRIEAEAVACLRHPNIVPVLDIGAHGGYPYLALEYVAGGSLHDRLAEFRSDPLRIVNLIAGVASGLHHAHRLGLLHRDLKPQNILLSQDGTPKITDFGLAKFTVSGKTRDRLRNDSILPGIRGSLMTLDHFIKAEGWLQEVAQTVRGALNECEPQFAETVSMKDLQQFVTDAVQQREPHDTRFLEFAPTRSGDLLGTPAYMSPEQAAGDPAALGPWTDVYGLGVILYQLLFGQLPFTSRSIAELFDQIRRVQPVAVDSSQPPELVRICLRCLAKKPEDRFPSAAALEEELVHCRAGMSSTRIAAS